MGKEMGKIKIESIIESRDANLSQDKAEKAWRKMLALYRLRFHEGYLIRTEPALIIMAGIIKEIYPNFGKSLFGAFDKIFNDSESAKVVLNEIYPQLGINFKEPPTAEEKDVLKKVLSPSKSPFMEKLSPSVKEEILEFFFGD